MSAMSRTLLARRRRPHAGRPGRRPRAAGRGRPHRLGRATTPRRCAADAADEVVELDGALVTPAFVDAHAHTTETGLALAGLDLHRRVVAWPRPCAGWRTPPGAAPAGRCSATAGTRRALARGPRRRPAHELDRGGVRRRSSTWPGSTCTPRRSRRALAAAPELRDLPRLVRRRPGRARRPPRRPRRRPRRHQRPALRRELQRRRRCRPRPPPGIGCVHEMSAPHIVRRRGPADLLGAVADRPDLPDVVGYWGELVATPTRRGVAGVARAGPAPLLGWPATCSPTARSARTRRRCARRYTDDAATPRARLPRRPSRSPTTSSPARGPGCRPASTSSATRPSTPSRRASSRRPTSSALAAVRAGPAPARARRDGRRRRASPTWPGSGMVASVQPVFDACVGRRRRACTPSGSAPDRAPAAQPVRATWPRPASRWRSAPTPRSRRGPVGRPCAPRVHHHDPAQRISAERRLAPPHRGGWRRRRRRRVVRRLGRRPAASVDASAAT